MERPVLNVAEKNHFALMCKQQEDSEDEHNRVHEIELYNQEETARNYVIE